MSKHWKIGRTWNKMDIDGYVDVNIVWHVSFVDGFPFP